MLRSSVVAVFILATCFALADSVAPAGRWSFVRCAGALTDRTDPSTAHAFAPGAQPPPAPTATDVPERVRVLTVRGVVVEESGGRERVLSGTRVVVFARPGHCEWSVLTDAGGRFERRCFDVGREGDLEVHAVPPWDFLAWFGRIRLGLSDPLSGTLDIRIPLARRPATATPMPVDELPYVIMHGSVVGLGSGQEKRPLVGARVEVDGPWCLSPVFTNEAGQFEAVCPVANYIGFIVCIGVALSLHFSDPASVSKPPAQSE